MSVKFYSMNTPAIAAPTMAAMLRTPARVAPAPFWFTGVDDTPDAAAVAERDAAGAGVTDPAEPKLEPEEPVGEEVGDAGEGAAAAAAPWTSNAP